MLSAAPALAAALGVISAALLLAGNWQLAGVVACLALVPAGVWDRERRRRAEESGLAEREWHFDQRVKTVRLHQQLDLHKAIRNQDTTFTSPV